MFNSSVHSRELCSQYPASAVMYLLLPFLGFCAFVGERGQYWCDPIQVLKTIGLGTPGRGFNGGQGDGGLIETNGGGTGANAGGGGGAGGPGIGAFTSDRINNTANQGSGGPEKLSDITGVPLYYAGGGGGGVWDLEVAAYKIQANLGVSFAFSV